MSDLTEEGALLAAPGWLGMPECFTLSMRHQGLSFDCRIVSRGTGTLRVRFV